MDEQLVSLILGLIGTSGGVWVGIKEIQKWRSGRAAEEREENQTLVDRALLAEQQMEREAYARRVMEDYASFCRGIIRELGGKPPSWPNINKILGRDLYGKEEK